MGFFTDLKEDLAMAVNELMPEEAEDVIREEEVTTEAFEEEVKDVVSEEEEQLTADDFELDKMLENLDSLDIMPEQTEETVNFETVATEEATEAVEVAEEAADEPEAEAAPELEIVAEEAVATDYEDKNTQDKGVEFKMDSMANRTVSDETAVITQGMVITGDIISEGSMDVIGTIIGNIEILGKLNITGSIQGNSKASEIFADNAKITGEVVSEGSVKIGQSSVIIGNITATSAVIAGAVKGDIDVQGPVILDTSAIVMGNIKSKSVQINNGAVIEGMCSQCYADVNPTSFFDELKKNK